MFASARSLARQPSFVVAAVGTLAIGIAASTALFSTVNAALLTPLPYPHARDIYTVRTYFPNGRFTIGLVASEEMESLKQCPVAEGAMSLRSDSAIATGDPGSGLRPVVAYAVSGHFFDLFGAPMLGRGITDVDDVRGAAPVIVLSHELWTTAYGADPNIVGTTIAFNNTNTGRVIGVAAPAFDVPSGADLWISAWMPITIGHGYEGYVRLPSGWTPGMMQKCTTEVMAALGTKYPDQDKDRAYRLTPLLDATVGDLGPVLVILFGATGLLLVLAAANVTNLMLTRSTGRAREFAVRAALGASRARLVVHLVTESLLLSAVGGAAGLLAAYAAVRLLVRLGGSRLPRLAALTFDWTVVAFVIALVLVTGFVVGIVPALRMAKTDIASLMNQSGRSVRGSRGTRRLLSAFVVAEVAVTVALVAGATRLVSSYTRLSRVDPGFDPQGRLVLDVMLPQSLNGMKNFGPWWRSVDAQLRAAGATHVGASSSLPLAHEWDVTTFVDIVSQPNVPPELRPNARLRFVTPDWFATMGIRLVAGRPLSEQDTADAPPVAVVNQAFARRFLGTSDPLRERVKDIHYRIVDNKPIDDEVAIVGVVGDVQYAALNVPAEPIVYTAIAQYRVGLRTSIVVTSADGHPERRSAEFRNAIRSIDSHVSVDVDTMTTRIAASLERQRLGMWLMSAFGIAALVLAAVGIFGVIAYVVAQRTGEMAIRQALGATRGEVFRMVVAEGGRVAAVGVAGGLVLAWWTGSLIGRYVYQVRPGDPVVLIGSAVTVLALALASTLVPALRAASFEPAQALRQE